MQQGSGTVHPAGTSPTGLPDPCKRFALPLCSHPFDPRWLLFVLSWGKKPCAEVLTCGKGDARVGLGKGRPGCEHRRCIWQPQRFQVIRAAITFSLGALWK